MVYLSFALLCALCWTAANFAIRRASKRFSPFIALFWSLVFGTGFLGLVALALAPYPQHLSGSSILLILLAGGSAIVAYGGLFLAFESGRVSVVSPIIGSWSVLGAAIGLLFLEESLSPPSALGVGLVIFGNLLLASTEIQQAKGKKTGRYALPAAFASAIGFGCMAPLTDRLADDAGKLWAPALVWGCAAGILVILRLCILNRRSPGDTRKTREMDRTRSYLDLGSLSLPAVLEASGFLFLTLALAGSPLSIVAPVCSLSTGMTVLAGLVLLRERLHGRSLIGAIAASAGVALVQM